MPFTVQFLPLAVADIRRIVAWCDQHGQRDYAARWRAGLLTNVVSKLEADPHRYPAAEEATDLGIALRCLLYGRQKNRYRIVFTVDGMTVNILRIRHAAQDTLQADDL